MLIGVLDFEAFPLEYQFVKALAATTVKGKTLLLLVRQII